MERIYDYPVWETQGGGLVREVSGTYIFVQKPDCPGLDVGDRMPAEWGIIPANSRARNEMDGAEWGESPEDRAMFNSDVECLFGMLFDKTAAGEIRHDQIGGFFPKDVQERNT